jgi:toxin YxiD
LREKLYGEQATRNHEGAAFAAGQITGGITSLATGVGTPANFAKGLGWAQKAAIGYDVAATGYGAYDATKRIKQGCGSALDALNFLPAVGYGASRLKGATHGLDDVGRGLDDIVSSSTKNELNNAADNLVEQASDTSTITLFNPVFASEQVLKNGRINESKLKQLISKDAQNTFIPSDRIAQGYKYTDKINGNFFEVKWHSPDSGLNSGINSSNDWTAQIKVKKKFLGQDGKWYRKPNNLTHIPVDFK